MPRGLEATLKERILICAPFGRDGVLIQRELQAAGLSAEVHNSVEEIADRIGQGAGAALIADEALVASAIKVLVQRLAEQPPWSDFPLVIMTSGGDATQDSRYRLRLTQPLGNVTLLERPLRTATLVSCLRAVLRARNHQYQLAELLQERVETELEIRRQNEQLTKANRELEEFAYVSSHDLQEPLRMINIYTQLLTRYCDRNDRTIQEYAGFIQEGVARMGTLLRDLLTFSHTIHAEQSTVKTADLGVSLANAVSTLSKLIQETGADVRVSELPTVLGDEAQFAHVFQNLLSNALKYRKPDVCPQITVSAEKQGAAWLLSVRDNGIGFESQYAKRIFGLFKRLHKDAYPGTGLGLAICQRIIERFGGEIWAEGHPGEGSTFFFTLPEAGTAGLGMDPGTAAELTPETPLQR